MFLRTLIVLALFFPFFSFALTGDPYTSDQSSTYTEVNIVETGFQFNVHTHSGTTLTSEVFNTDNALEGDLTGSATDHTVWFTVEGGGCTYGPFVKIRWNGIALDTNSSPDYDVVSSSTESENTGSNTLTDMRFYQQDCDVDTTVTIHKIDVNGTVLFDYLPSEPEATTPSPLLPPTQTISLLSTTTCTGSSTSSVCTYEYSTTSATSTEGQYLSYILEHLKTAFLYAVWLSSFCLILGVLLLFMRGRYGHY